jgi:hypothetical protein
VGTYENGEERSIWYESLKEKYYWEYLNVGGKIILKWMLNKLNGVMGWIYMDEDRDQLQTLDNTIMKLWVP